MIHSTQYIRRPSNSRAYITLRVGLTWYNYWHIKINDRYQLTSDSQHQCLPRLLVGMHIIIIESESTCWIKILCCWTNVAQLLYTAWRHSCCRVQEGGPMILAQLKLTCYNLTLTYVYCCTTDHATESKFCGCYHRIMIDVGRIIK